MTFRSQQNNLANELTNHKQNLKSDWSLLEKLRMLAIKMPAVKFKTEPKKIKNEGKQTLQLLSNVVCCGHVNLGNSSGDFQFSPYLSRYSTWLNKK